MSSLIGSLIGVDPSLLQLCTALLGLIAASATCTTAVVGLLNRRIRKRTEATADSTHGIVRDLVGEIRAQRREHDDLWAAFLQKDAVANPEGVRRIATETATAVTAEALRPMHQFYAAVEIVEHRREHRPETDVIRILQEINA